MGKGRGRKPLDRTSFHVRVDPQTPSVLNDKARKLGYIYGSGGATGELLDAIAKEKLILVPQEEWEKFKKIVTTLKNMNLE
jgi:hypothetical protein